MMKIKITQIITVIYDADLDSYDEEDRNSEGVIRVESENAEEYGSQYMDLFSGAETQLTFEPVD
jgi:hypothetical protein